MTSRELVSLIGALVPLGIAIVEYQERVKAELVTHDVITAVNASLDGVQICGTR